MNIHIYYNYHDNPWGGGNQFLKALKKQFIFRGVYCESPAGADIILFNSHHCLREILRLKRMYPDKIFIHRVDGPIFKLRNDNIRLDRLVFLFNEKIADATIFQSDWSRQECQKLGLSTNNPSSVIHNAPDGNIFFPAKKKSKSQKTRIIASSWSNNLKKGFDIYEYLDSNLDFSRYEMKFIGNSPVTFKNIIYQQPIPSQELAEELRKADLFLTGSIDDPCSNSLIEAIHTGLIVLARHSGGHIELVDGFGTTFNGKEDVLEKIEQIRADGIAMAYQKNSETIELITEKYRRFFKDISQTVEDKIRKLNSYDYLQLFGKYYYWKLLKRFR